MSDTIQVASSDGFELGVRLFQPLGTPRASVVIAGGTGIPQRFYGAYAERLAAHGFLAATFDYRGVGASRRRETVRGGMLTWAEDGGAVLRFVRERTPGSLFYVGHSFGGQALGLMPNAHAQIDAAVLVAAQSGYYGHWPMPSRLPMAALWHGVVPSLVRVFDRLPGWAGLGEDLPPEVALEWAAWCRSPGYLSRVVPEERQYFHRLRTPLLAFAFTDDSYAPGRSVDELLSWFRNAEIEKRVRSPRRLGMKAIGHHGFFRRGSAELWNESIDWIERRLLSASDRAA